MSAWTQTGARTSSRPGQEKTAPSSQGRHLPDSTNADNPGKLLKTFPFLLKCFLPVPPHPPTRGKDSSPFVGPGPFKIPAGHREPGGQELRGSRTCLKGLSWGGGVLELRLTLDPLPTKVTRRSPEGRRCWGHENLIVFLQAQDTPGLHLPGEAITLRPA